MEILPGLHRIINTPGVVRKEERLHREYPTKDKPLGWRTTNPLKHDPNNYRYIVHTTSKGSLDSATWLTYARKLGPVREMTGNPWEVLIEDFLARNSTSCTMVDEIHRATYKWDVMPQGFILDVPEENIIAIRPGDLGINNVIQDKQERDRVYQNGIKRKCDTPSAQAFIETCSHDFYNEVLVDGVGPEGRQIRIAGIFFITDPYLGTPLNELYSRLSWHPRDIIDRIYSYGKSNEEDRVNRFKREYQEMKNVAQLLHVPIIHIPALLL